MASLGLRWGRYVPEALRQGLPEPGSSIEKKDHNMKTQMKMTFSWGPSGSPGHPSALQQPSPPARPPGCWTEGGGRIASEGNFEEGNPFGSQDTLARRQTMTRYGIWENTLGL